MFDWLHIVDYGVASHACGNIIFEIVFLKLTRKTRGAAINEISERLQELGSDQGSEVDRLERNHFSNLKSPHQHYPEMHQLKAAQVRGLVGKSAILFESYTSDSLEEKHQPAMIQSLAVLSETMHSAEITFTTREFRVYK